MRGLSSPWHHFRSARSRRWRFCSRCSSLRGPLAAQSAAAPSRKRAARRTSFQCHRFASRSTAKKHTPTKHKPRPTRRAGRQEWRARRGSSRPLWPRQSCGPWPSNWPLLRTPEAYAGVTAYAHSHTGEAAAAAYLALGHAYLLDKRYAEAETALAAGQARRRRAGRLRRFSGRRGQPRGRRRCRCRGACCTALPSAIPTASSMPRRPSWRPTCCWR